MAPKAKPGGLPTVGKAKAVGDSLADAKAAAKVAAAKAAVGGKAVPAGAVSTEILALRKRVTEFRKNPRSEKFTKEFCRNVLGELQLSADVAEACWATLKAPAGAKGLVGNSLSDLDKAFDTMYGSKEALEKLLPAAIVPPAQLIVGADIADLLNRDDFLETVRDIADRLRDGSEAKCFLEQVAKYDYSIGSSGDNEDLPTYAMATVPTATQSVVMQIRNKFSGEDWISTKLYEQAKKISGEQDEIRKKKNLAAYAEVEAIRARQQFRQETFEERYSKRLQAWRKSYERVVDACGCGEGKKIYTQLTQENGMSGRYGDPDSEEEDDNDQGDDGAAPVKAIRPKIWTGLDLQEYTRNALYMIDVCDHEGTHPLAEAAMSGDIDTVKFLLSLGCHVNNPDQVGKTALYRISTNLEFNNDDDVEMVQLLLDADADPRAGSAVSSVAELQINPKAKHGAQVRELLTKKVEELSGSAEGSEGGFQKSYSERMKGLEFMKKERKKFDSQGKLSGEAEEGGDEGRVFEKYVKSCLALLPLPWSRMVRILVTNSPQQVEKMSAKNAPSSPSDTTHRIGDSKVAAEETGQASLFGQIESDKRLATVEPLRHALEVNANLLEKNNKRMVPPKEALTAKDSDKVWSDPETLKLLEARIRKDSTYRDSLPPVGRKIEDTMFHRLEAHLTKQKGEGVPNIVEWFLTMLHELDPNTLTQPLCSSNGGNSLWWACAYGGNTIAAHVLLKLANGKDATSKPSEYGPSDLDSHLLYLDPNSATASGITCLMQACLSDNVPLVARLLEEPGIVLSVKSDLKRTALDFAQGTGGKTIHGLDNVKVAAPKVKQLLLSESPNTAISRGFVCEKTAKALFPLQDDKNWGYWKNLGGASGGARRDDNEEEEELLFKDNRAFREAVSELKGLSREEIEAKGPKYQALIARRELANFPIVSNPYAATVRNELTFETNCIV